MACSASTAALDVPEVATEQERGRPDFQVVSEAVLHQRYLTVYNRRVHFGTVEQLEASCQASRELNFDVVGHPRSNFKFAVIFPFHPRADGRPGGEVTLIREYAQGPHQLMYCLPTGGFDPAKHDSMEACARAELSEETMLTGGQMQSLLPEGHPGMVESKWCANRFTPFLVVSPVPDLQPGARDPEELTIEVVRMPVSELKELMVSGEMLLPSITTCFVALQHLEREGYL